MPQASAARARTSDKQANPEDKGQTEETPPKGKPRRLSRPKTLHPLEKMLGETVVNARGESVTPKKFSLEDGVIALYFAAHWCPPCRSFCPSLMLLYDELKKRNMPFEVVYVSLDTSESSFTDYLAKMPWYAVNFEPEEKREELAINFGIKGIPVLALLDAKSIELMAFNGRAVVARDPRGALFPWRSILDEEGNVARSPPPKTAPEAHEPVVERQRSPSFASTVGKRRSVSTKEGSIAGLEPITPERRLSMGGPSKSLLQGKAGR